MNRRSLFKMFAAAFAAPTIAKVFPKAVLKPVVGDTGISLRLTRIYNPATDLMVTRMDVLFGVASNPPKIGQTINVRRPARFIGKSGMAFEPEKITESDMVTIYG